MPEPKELHVDSTLTSLSVKYRNADMIWREVMPVVPVRKRSDKFAVYNREDMFKLPDDATMPKADANEIDWGVSFDKYSVEDYAIADYLPQETIDNADDPINPEIDTNDFLNLLLDIAQEKRVADVVFSAATYPVGNKVTLSGTSQWSDFTGSDPIGDILTALSTPLIRPNTLIFGQDTWTKFRQHPQVLDAVKSSTRFQDSPGGLATAPEVAGLFEVDKVLVGRASFISSSEGQTPTFTRLWGKHMSALRVEPNPGINTITFGCTFVEQQRTTMTVFDPKKGAKGALYIKVAWNADVKVKAPDVGYFIENAVA